ncbi:MAG: pentapeptide repeat-containing protein [Candidatus Methanoperedens sp.]|nr:pentapeptide repeat-containing protein [Candidatus Methanoperedens sp.]
MEKRPGYVGPLLLIAIGFILLFNKLGFVHWESWDSLWHYWPVILILWGIEIIARHTESAVMYFAAVFLSIVLIIASVLLAWNGYPASDKKGDNMMGIIFNNRNLENKKFNFADLDNADFNNSNLNGADMNFASMQYANFINSSLRGTNMNFADLKYAKLDNASLNGANLNFANLKNADLSNAVLDGANLNFVNLDDANMAGAQLKGANHAFAETSKSTICPDSTNGPCW